MEPTGDVPASCFPYSSKKQPAAKADTVVFPNISFIDASPNARLKRCNG